MEAMIDGKEIRKALGANVRRLRKQADMTQEELAAKVGISRVCMNCIERGNQSPKAEVLYALADALQVSADYLRQVPVAAP